jgi:hypothetical protein
MYVYVCMYIHILVNEQLGVGFEEENSGMCKADCV